MKLRRTLRFHGLKKPRIRQTWNKYNLYNMANHRTVLQTVKPERQTFFQQKWAAKRLARGYHGEHIKERAWERMFDRRLLSVVNMEPSYMARYDGSEQATGRGQGTGKTDELIALQRGSGQKTPYMQMAFAPMERRLDIAVFRALFASSARQARQFCVHGAVKVNGKRMKYPGYLLNPGDMFQVEPERVLFATGAKKDPSAIATDAEESESPEAVEATDEASEAAETAEESSESGSPAAEGESASSSPEDAAKAERESLKALRERVKTFLKTSFGDLSVKQKKALRSLSKDIKTAMSRTGRPSEETSVDSLSTLFSELELSISPEDSDKYKPDSERIDEETGLTKSEQERLSELLAEEAENPYDPDKPYATPWRPRPFMAPFVFVPRYLEVNHNICSAVYLRHPVARAGKAEVPSPWGETVNELAFNWYLRRR